MNENNEVIVNLLINKGELNGFGKVQEQIPVGYRAESIKSKNSIFTYKNHIVKFLWMNMPNSSGDDNFVVSYKLIPEGEIPDEEFQIVGTFSYAESDRTKTINIAERSVDLEKDNEVQVAVIHMIALLLMNQNVQLLLHGGKIQKQPQILKPVSHYHHH